MGMVVHWTVIEERERRTLRLIGEGSDPDVTDLDRHMRDLTKRFTGIAVEPHEIQPRFLECIVPGPEPEMHLIIHAWSET